MEIIFSKKTLLKKKLLARRKKFKVNWLLIYFLRREKFHTTKSVGLILTTSI